jgi:hypothetical protein
MCSLGLILAPSHACAEVPVGDGPLSLYYYDCFLYNLLRFEVMQFCRLTVIPQALCYFSAVIKNSVESVRERTTRPSDRRLSANLVPTFADRGCHVVSVTDPSARILGILDRSRYFIFQVARQLNLRGWVDPFQTHYFSENLVVSGIEPGPLDL